VTECLAVFDGGVTDCIAVCDGRGTECTAVHVELEILFSLSKFHCAVHWLRYYDT
jgi:hypothetical protein